MSNVLSLDAAREARAQRPISPAEWSEAIERSRGDVVIVDPVIRNTCPDIGLIALTVGGIAAIFALGFLAGVVLV